MNQSLAQISRVLKFISAEWITGLMDNIKRLLAFEEEAQVQNKT